jgi:opacity protein-like surface antigen
MVSPRHGVARTGWAHWLLPVRHVAKISRFGTVTSADRWGWTIGGGIEQALTERWSIVGAYRYVDLGPATVRFAGVPDEIAAVASERISQRYQTATVGLNYKLN